jgi:hypothetical protein
MTDFVQAGDTVLAASSDWALLSAYAVRRQDGSLRVLTINKDPVNTLTGQVSVTGFTPASEVLVYSYGIPQDQAVETGTGSPDIAQSIDWISSTNFNYYFPPYSATVMVLSPPAVQLVPMPVAPGATQFVFELLGASSVPYVIQYSTDLMNWTPVSTNTLSGNSLLITNAVAPSPPGQFWRVTWQQ